MPKADDFGVVTFDVNPSVQAPLIRNMAETTNSNMSSPENEHWFKSHWRPAAAWTYLAICIFDFCLAPIFFGWFSWFTHSTMVQWVPLTLQGGGLFHLSFGAIVGLYTWGRTKEKEAGADNVITGSKD